MSIIHLPNGIGDSTGYALATTSPLEVNGNVWYVHYTNGTDAASPAGQNRQAPLKTLAQANTNAASGDIIVLMDGHVETITSIVTITKNLTVVGAGTSGGYPTAKLTNNQAAAGMIELSGSAIQQIKNVWFEEQAQACSVAQLTIDGTGSAIIEGCYFEGGQYDDEAKLMIEDCVSAIVRNSTFISTATSIVTQPKSAIASGGESTIVNVVLDGVVVDGGAYGWSNYHAIDFSAVAPTLLCAQSVSLLRGSDAKIHSTTVGYFNAPTQSGGCRVDWDGVV